jgi:hypothetical protein
MRVAEVTYDQAAALDPALLQPDTAIAVRLGTVRAIIGPLVAHDAPVNLLVGELRCDDDRPLEGRSWGTNVTDIIRTAVATPEGLRGLLDALQGLAEGRTVRRARTAS